MAGLATENVANSFILWIVALVIGTEDSEGRYSSVTTKYGVNEWLWKEVRLNPNLRSFLLPFSKRQQMWPILRLNLSCANQD